MAVISVNEISNLRRLRDDAEEDSGTRGFIVIMSAVTDGPDVARTADDGSIAIPTMGDVHPDNAGINVATIDPQPTENRKIWTVIVEYSGAPGITVSSPTNEPWIISWGFENEQEVIAKTRTATNGGGDYGIWGVPAGDPIDNSVEDVFNPPLQENKALLISTLTKNKSAFDVAEAVAFMNTMNNASIVIAGHTAPKWTAKLVEYSAVPAKRGTTDYWVVKYRIMFDKDTFIREVLNVGLQEKVGGVKGKIKNALDGSLSDEGEKLDTNGAQTAVANYWGFGTLDEKNFSTLSLPTTM